MTQSIESAIATQASGASLPASAVREGILEIPGDVPLHHGANLTGVRLAWRLSGAPQAPVIVALGGISAHRRVCATDLPASGWWHEVAGPGLALDAAQWRILSFDYLGGSAETTGPRGGSPFPSISSYDQAELLLRLINHLGLRALRAIVGASYGGMVALAFAERYPDRVSQLVVISAGDRTHPMSTAWRSVQRRVVRFAQECGRPADGLRLARALAMSTYRSQEEFSARFSGAPRLTDSGFVFPVEEYLLARGDEYAMRYEPDGFLCLSESIDLHRIDATRVFTPTTVIAVREDQLVPLNDLRAMAARLPHARFHEMSSVYGHDAFLKEVEQLKPIFAKSLGAGA
jgi:homoserine O-acetyltransferase